MGGIYKKEYLILVGRGCEANKKGLFSLFVLGNADLLDRFNLGGCAGLELLDASSGVYDLCLARVERMAVVADIDVEFLLGRSYGRLVAAYAGNFSCCVIFWVNFCLHNCMYRCRRRQLLTGPNRTDR